MNRESNLLAFLFISLFLITSCSQSIPKQQSFSDEATQIMNSLQSRMEDKEELSKKEITQLELFTSKYSTESQVEKKSLVATYLAYLYVLHGSIISNGKSSEVIDKMRSFNETIIKIKSELG